MKATAKASLGVLFVHGMGAHAPGATLRAFADPVVALLSHPAIGATGVTLTETKLADGAPAHTRCTFTACKDDRQQTWLMAESCWSDSFKPAAYPRIAFWLIASVPWTIGEYLRGAWKREGNALRYRWIRSVRKLLILVYGALATLLTGPLVVVLTLLLAARLIPIKPVRDLFDRIPRALAESLGDVYVILTTHVDQAAIRAQVMRDYRWLGKRCGRRVVVAHSAGATVTHALLRDRTMTGVHTYVTLGEAIWRMRWMSALSQDTPRRVVGLALSLLGTAAIVAAVPVALKPESRTIGIAVLVCGIALHAASALVVWLFGIRGTRTDVMRELDGKVPTWRDYVASSDPIPAGALTEIAHGTTPAGRETGAASPYVPIGVHNRRSIFRDHTSYPDNVDEFVAGLTADLAAADGADLGIKRWSLPEWKKDRTIRTLSLALLRFGSGLTGVAVLLVLGLHADAFAALGDETAPGRAVKSVVGDPGVAGALIAIALLAAAWLVAGFGWKLWDRAALRSLGKYGESRPYIALSFWWAAWTTLAAGLALSPADLKWRSWEAAAVAGALVVGLLTQLAVVTVAEVRDDLYESR